MKRSDAENLFYLRSIIVAVNRLVEQPLTNESAHSSIELTFPGPEHNVENRAHKGNAGRQH